MKKQQVAVVIQDKDTPIERNVLAQAIVEISSAMKKLLSTGLNRDAVITLVAARVKPTNRMGNKPGKADIEAVFNALSSLERDFCR